MPGLETAPSRLRVDLQVEAITNHDHFNQVCSARKSELISSISASRRMSAPTLSRWPSLSLSSATSLAELKPSEVNAVFVRSGCSNATSRALALRKYPVNVHGQFRCKAEPHMWGVQKSFLRPCAPPVWGSEEESHHISSFLALRSGSLRLFRSVFLCTHFRPPSPHSPPLRCFCPLCLASLVARGMSCIRHCCFLLLLFS